MLGRVKRKHEEDTDLECYTHQRQSILNISMCKLRTSSLRRVEPCLRRSVLIFNTLKFIEEELRQEGVKVYDASKPSILPSIQCEEMALDPIPCQDHMTHLELSSIGNNVNKTDIEEPKTPNVAVSDTAAIVSTPSSDNSSSAAPLILTTTSAIALSVPVTGSTDILGTHAVTPQRNIASTIENGLDKLLTVESLSSLNLNSLFEDENIIGSSILSSLSSCWTSPSKVDDPLGDIDMAGCDFDLLSPASPNVKLPVTPITTDDLARTFSNMDVLLPSSCGVDSCRNDLLWNDELENIMQVLVGM
ncbi:uncharacterized protein LOC106156325 [Lingula anatina]|uniref:Uncharacterized protein LOC106156325 n=1 Tax=Lingula anatina TaxID=7574 RepID=A0A1S3HN91_LINAN|nr:uncharacterized protein LOC106156325 [Lingula anatina]XP_013386976.1 uncharacterized protein LOC106156325 [Lingula anatina]XP_013386977.1 uncharacterized protein LOC106156325 [Lingula anatina]XP_013386978.1 uncharacterized protein LOC106156325 [Lingula anatina]XP_013386980.1 uncharacterized protein LOC106156325 [Lingula anatina]XP_013386981.1 uncharacterized protein LOC106156325 [Lingula anatina]|eukprot:XP_013386975.1 uncharacterized protein LOC106156325 [Lingula anatina]